MSRSTWACAILVVLGLMLALVLPFRLKWIGGVALSIAGRVILVKMARKMNENATIEKRQMEQIFNGTFSDESIWSVDAHLKQ